MKKQPIVFIPEPISMNIVWAETSLSEYVSKSSFIINDKYYPASVFEKRGGALTSKGVLSLKENAYVLTPEELLELRKKWAEEAWDKGRKDYEEDYYYQERGIERKPSVMDKETYLNSLNID